MVTDNVVAVSVVPDTAGAAVVIGAVVSLAPVPPPPPHAVSDSNANGRALRNNLVMVMFICSPRFKI
jgi:hypothetical protein